MTESLKLYRASPEAFFSSLDKKLLEFNSQLTNCLNQLDSLGVLADQFMTTKAPLQLARPQQTSWVYDARLPNPYFDDVFEPEHLPNFSKRWVGRSGRLRVVLGMPRTLQYNFMVKVEDFSLPELAKDFALSVDGQTYPWLDAEKNCFTTIIQESAASAFLEIELSVDASAIPMGTDVSFSFSKIAVDKRG